ncbi:hypothetical protein [Planktothrix mougeotii]|nr:hypothetical protein [Planktothrix mougeotii]
MNTKSQSKRRAIAVTLSMAGMIVWGNAVVVVPVKAETIEQLSNIVAQSPTPVTNITEVNNNKIMMEITEGEFRFRGYLKRTSGNKFMGEDRQVRVMYDRDTNRVVVINVVTGTEFYNYIFSDVDEGAL